MDELQIKMIAIKHGCGSHSELNIQLAESVPDFHFPNLLTLDVVTSEEAGAEKYPNMFSICARRRGCGIAFAGSSVGIPGTNLVSPQDLSIVGIDT
jgi:hypothetical protein